MTPLPRVLLTEPPLPLDKTEAPAPHVFQMPLVLADLAFPGEDPLTFEPLSVFSDEPHIMDGFLDSLLYSWEPMPVLTGVTSFHEMTEENYEQHRASYAALIQMHRETDPEDDDEDLGENIPPPTYDSDSDSYDEEKEMAEMDKFEEEEKKFRDELFFKRPYEDADEGLDVPTEIDIIRNMFGFYLPQAGVPRSDSETVQERDERRYYNFFATLRAYMSETERRLKIKRERNDPTPSMIFIRNFTE